MPIREAVVDTVDLVDPRGGCCGQPPSRERGEMEQLAIPKNLYDLCEHRERAIKLFTASYATIKGVEKDLQEAGQYLTPYNCVPKINPEDFQKQLDKNLWRHAFNQIGLLQYMDAQAKDELDKDLEKTVPDFTIDNVKTTLLTAAQNADKMFARGIVNIFFRLSGEHKTNTNSPFKINRKAVIGYMATLNYSGGLRVNTWGSFSERINDIDRVIKTLDGKKHQQRELEFLVNGAWGIGEVYEDDYYKIKGFKNGNMHIEFKRQDLLDKANLIIARYYDGNNLVA